MQQNQSTEPGKFCTCKSKSTTSNTNNQNQQNPNNKATAQIQNTDEEKEDDENEESIFDEQPKNNRDRRRTNLMIEDSRELPTYYAEEEVEDGRIQNKNIVIDLQPIVYYFSF